MGHAVVGYLLGGWRGLGLSVQQVKIAVPSSRVSQGTLAAPEERFVRSATRAETTENQRTVQAPIQDRELAMKYQTGRKFFAVLHDQQPK